MDSVQKYHLKRGLVVCLFFVLVVAVLPDTFHGRGYDYYFHYAKAAGAEKSPSGSNLTIYPPLYSWLSSPFSFRETTFYYVGLLMLGFAIPLLLVNITRNWLAALIYFSATSFFYFFEQGVYGQALALLLCLVVLNWSDYRIRFAALALGLLAHSTGFVLVAGFWLACALNEAGIIDKLYRLSFLPACSGWFPTNRPDWIEQDIFPQEIVSTSNTDASRALDYAKLGKLFFEIFPLPFMILAVKGFVLRKDFHLLAIFILGLVGGVFHYRLFYISALVGVIGLTRFAELLQGRNRTYFYGLVLFFAVLQFWVWFSYKFNCFPLGEYN